MRRLIAATLLVLATLSPIWASEPLTEKEADAWLRSISLEELVKFVIKYDWVEHAQPKIIWPKTYGLETEDRVVITSPDRMIISIGHLQYEAEMPSIEFQKSKEKFNYVPYLIISILSFSFGATLTAILF